MSHIRDKAGEIRKLRELMDQSGVYQSLVPPWESAFPAGHKFTIDLASITSVDPTTGTLELSCLGLNRAPSRVQWLSPMLDPRTGQGVYFVPKPGMYGIYISVGGNDYFGPMFGLTEVFGDQFYLNFRETMPEGSFCVKTSSETKQIWSPNLISMAAGNFIRILMKRVDKLFDLLCYSFNIKSLGGSISMITDLRSRATQFSFKVRNLLAPSTDSRGQKPKSDPAREISLLAGAVPALNDRDTTNQVLRFSVNQVTGPGEGSSLETPAVVRLRQYARSTCEDGGFTSSSLSASPEFVAFDVAFSPFITGADTTLDLLVESIVAGGTFIRQAQPDGINGLTDLAPAQDSVENLITGEITPLGSRDPGSLNVDTEVLVGANRLENKGTTATNGNDGVPLRTLGTVLVERARSPSFDEIDPTQILSLMRLEIDQDGNLFITQKNPAASPLTPIASPDKAKGRTEWTLASLLKIIAQSGPIDIDAGRGLRLAFSSGFTLAGPNGAAITVTPDGAIELDAQRITHRSFSDRPAFGTKEFMAEEDALEDLSLIEAELRRRKDIDVNVTLFGRFEYDPKSNTTREVTRGLFPPGSEPVAPKHYYDNIKEDTYPGSQYIRYGAIDEIQPAIVLNYNAALKTYNRKVSWAKRIEYSKFEASLQAIRDSVQTETAARRAAASNSKTAIDLYKKGYAQIVLNRIAASKKLASQTAAQRDAAKLTDSANMTQLDPYGFTLRTNSSASLRAGARIEMVNDYPSGESQTTRKGLRDSSRDATGVPDFKGIDALKPK